MNFWQNLFFLVAMLASLAIFVCSVISLLKKIHGNYGSDAGRAFQKFTLFVLAAAAVMFLPVYCLSYSFKDIKVTFIRSVLLSVHNAMRIFILDGEFDFVRDQIRGMYGLLHVLFSLYASVLYVAAPVIFTFTIFLTIFRDLYAEFQFRANRRATLYVFSCLNEESAAMAESILMQRAEKKTNDAEGDRTDAEDKKTAKDLIVFCGVPRDKEERDKLADLAPRVPDTHASVLLMRKTVDELDISHFENDVTFFLMEKAEDKNIRDASGLTDRLKKQLDEGSDPNKRRDFLQVVFDLIDCLKKRFGSEKENKTEKPERHAVRILVYASEPVSVPLIDAIAKGVSVREDIVLPLKKIIDRACNNIYVPPKTVGKLKKTLNGNKNQTDESQKTTPEFPENFEKEIFDGLYKTVGHEVLDNPIIDSEDREVSALNTPARKLYFILGGTYQEISAQGGIIVRLETSDNYSGNENKPNAGKTEGKANASDDNHDGVFKEVIVKDKALNDLKAEIVENQKGLSVSYDTVVNLKDFFKNMHSVTGKIAGLLIDIIVKTSAEESLNGNSAIMLKTVIDQACIDVSLAEKTVKQLNDIIDKATANSGNKSVILPSGTIKSILRIIDDAYSFGSDGNVRSVPFEIVKQLKLIVDEVYISILNTIQQGVNDEIPLPISEPFSVMRIDIKAQMALRIIRDFQTSDVFRSSLKTAEELTVTLLGMGGIGKEILENLLWMCQQYGRKLIINVVDATGPELDETDPDAARNPLYDRLSCRWPELMQTNRLWQRIRDIHPDTESEYDVRFFLGMDCFSGRFRSLFESDSDNGKRLLKSDLVICSLGNDGKNLEAAVMMWQLFAGKAAGRIELKGEGANAPEIYAIIYDNRRSVHVKEQGDLKNYKAEPYNIVPKGSMRTQYSFAGIEQLEKEEKEAVIHHISWIWTSSETEDDPWYTMSDKNKTSSLKTQLDNYVHYEYYRRSSLAKAKHRDMLDKLGVFSYNTFPDDHDHLGPNCKCTLCRSRISEHMRWNAYMRVNGYRDGEKKNDMAKIHPCLKPWNKLPRSEQVKD